MSKLWNPYFSIGSTLPTNEWDLVVGYIHPAAHTGTISAGRVYDPTGVVRFPAKDFKWLAGTTSSRARSFLYYATNLTEQQRFWNPRVEMVDAAGGPEDVYWANPVAAGSSIDFAASGGGVLEAVSCSSDPLLLASAPVRVNHVISAPVITAVARESGRKVDVSAAEPSAGAQIRYTLNGAAPTESSTLYTQGTALRFSTTTALRFRAFREGFDPSAVVIRQVRRLSSPQVTRSGTIAIMNTTGGAQVKYLRRYPNLLRPENWVVGTSGSQTSFTMNGDAVENTIVLGLTPYETSKQIWVASNRDVVPNADGGWISTNFAINTNLTYRYSVWLKKDGGRSGSSFFGTDPVNGLNGARDANPYFWSGSTLSTNEWELVVGYIHPAAHTGTVSAGRVYDPSGGVRFMAKDFKWLAGTTSSRARSFLYYSTNLTEQQSFWNPRVEIVDSTSGPADVYWASAVASGSSVDFATAGGSVIEAISYSPDPLLLASAPIYAIGGAASPAMASFMHGENRVGATLSTSVDWIRIEIEQTGAKVRVLWPGSPRQLLEAGTPEGPWEHVEDAQSPHIIYGERTRFFKLRTDGEELRR